jgi:hypothetical protein
MIKSYRSGLFFIMLVLRSCSSQPIHPAEAIGLATTRERQGRNESGGRTDSRVFKYGVMEYHNGLTENHNDIVV